tara:strand:+ start:1355 stop:2011 length:657 start_codon:yes stop_codon:yes gene_type:complete
MVKDLANHAPLFLSLIVVSEVIGSIPIYLSSVRNLSKSQRRIFAIRSVMAASVLLLAITVLAKLSIKLLGSQDAIYQISIGALLFAFSVFTMFEKSDHALKNSINSQNRFNGKAFAFAANSIATPGVMLTLLLLAELHAGSLSGSASIIIQIFVALLLTIACLINAHEINKIIGKLGANIVRRISAIVIAFIAIDAVVRGFDESLLAKAAAPAIAHFH